jgi:hypothetical protein
MFMEVIADIFLVAGALGAALYCFVLARRLARFNDLETGIGGAVAVLSAQVDDLTKTLAAAQNTASESTVTLERLTERADSVARRLELLVASLHDLQDVEKQPVAVSPALPEKGDTLPTEPMFTRHIWSDRAASK